MPACSNPPSEASVSTGSPVTGRDASAPGDDADLALERGVVDAGAAARHLGGSRAGERGDQRGRRCRVADAHVAGEQAVVPACHEVRGDLGPRQQAGHRLVVRHGGLDRQVRGAPPDLAVQHVLVGRDIGGDAHVDDVHLRPCLPGQHVDRGTAGTEVLDHRRGDLLRPRRHPLRVHPVVTGEHRDRGPAEWTRRADPLDAAQRHRGRLQHAERAGGLGELALALPALGHGACVGRHDGREQLVQVRVRRHPPILVAPAAALERAHRAD